MMIFLVGNDVCLATMHINQPQLFCVDWRVFLPPLILLETATTHENGTSGKVSFLSCGFVFSSHKKWMNRFWFFTCNGSFDHLGKYIPVATVHIHQLCTKRTKNKSRTTPNNPTLKFIAQKVGKQMQKISIALTASNLENDLY